VPFIAVIAVFALGVRLFLAEAGGSRKDAKGAKAQGSQSEISALPTIKIL